MEATKKISYKDDFSDSDSTIIDSEIGVNEIEPAVSSETNASTSFNAFNSQNNYLLHKFLKKQDDDELQSILEKYSNPRTNPNPSITSYATFKSQVDTIELSSDEDLPPVGLLLSSREQNKKDNLDLPEITSNHNVNEENIIDKNINKVSSKSRKRDCQILLDKEEKKKKKIQMQEEAANQKQIKQDLAKVNRNIKPENCMKYLTVTLDSNIINEKYGGEILNALQALEVSYRFETQLFPNTVTWKRKTEQFALVDNESIENSEDGEVDEALLIMDWKETINLINDETLLPHIESTKAVMSKSRLFILIYEIENYFNYWKRQKLKSHKVSNKKDKLYGEVPNIERKQLETTLTELQVLHSCCHQFIENPQVMGEMIAHFTKSIALVPYKMQKYEKQQKTDWFMSGDNRDCVKVDKNGNGLRRLWQQQLTTFQLARLEHAEAIVTKYPTLSSLLEECNNSEYGEKVLQDLPIRRAAGPLTTVRRIGPELSKKMYTYFTSTEGELPI